MSYIYKITNLIDGKVYIGLTTRTVEMRWKEHCRHDSLEVDKAIQEYGKYNFTIETLEECDDSILDDREQYWINYYNSYNNGYNQTLGGREENCIVTNKIGIVLDLWSQGLTVNKIVEATKLNVETVRSYLNKNGVDHQMIRDRANKALSKYHSKPVLQYDLNGNFIKEWPSSKEAGNELKISAGNIRSVCAGQRKTCANFIWKYKEDYDKEC